MSRRRGARRAGCVGEPTTIFVGTDQSEGIAADGKNVYWSDEAGTIMRCLVTGCGGNPTIIASGEGYPVGIAIDGKNVYWADRDSGTISSCPLAGCIGSPTILAS